MNETGLRMSRWISEVMTLNTSSERQRYFVYTHGGAIKYLASHLLGWSHQQTYQTEIDNTSVSMLTIQNGICQVAYLNRDAEMV